MGKTTAPAFAIKSAQWTLSRGDQLHSSGWTGKGIVIADPWSARWKAHTDLAAIQGEANARIIKSFIARCRGQTQAFKIFATAGAQNANTGVTLSAAASQGDTTVIITGASTSLLDGQLITINDQLLCLTADQSSSTLTFFPPLREDAASGISVETANPYALMFLADSRQGWSISPGRLFGVSFDCVEADSVDDMLLREDSSFVLREDGSLVLLE